MPKDRKQDRHATPARIIRPDPPELWDKLGQVVGTRSRSKAVSELIQRLVDGEIRLKTLPESRAEPAD